MMEPRMATKENIPKGAQILSRTEAFVQRFELVTQHKPLSDVFLLRYGGAAVGSLAAISGILLLRHFRRCLGLRKEAYISSSLACSMIPCSLSFMHHSIFVLPTIILEEPVCSVCREVKSAGVQLVTGVAMPLAFALITSTFTAYKLGSNVPLFREPVALFQFGKQMLETKGGMQKVSGLAILSVFGAMLLVNAEAIQMVQFRRRVHARMIMSPE